MQTFCFGNRAILFLPIKLDSDTAFWIKIPYITTTSYLKKSLIFNKKQLHQNYIKKKFVDSFYEKMAVHFNRSFFDFGVDGTEHNWPAPDQ